MKAISLGIFILLGTISTQAASIYTGVPTNASVVVQLHSLSSTGIVAKWYATIIMQGEKCRILLQDAKDLQQPGTRSARQTPIPRSFAIATYQMATAILSEFSLDESESGPFVGTIEHLSVDVGINGKSLLIATRIRDRKSASRAIRDLLAACEEQFTKTKEHNH